MDVEIASADSSSPETSLSSVDPSAPSGLTIGLVSGWESRCLFFGRSLLKVDVDSSVLTVLREHAGGDAVGLAALEDVSGSFLILLDRLSLLLSIA